MRLFELKHIPMDFLLIFEGKEEWIIKNYGPALMQSAQRERGQVQSIEQLVEVLKEFDPTREKKYLTFLAKMYAAKQFRLEDKSRIVDTLSMFDKVKGKLQNKDIMSYKKFSEVDAAIQPFLQQPETAVSNRQQVKQVKTEGAKKIIDTPNFKVIQPLTEEAAKFYGANTKWCTAGDKDNKFEYYNGQGPIYIIIAGNRKFQFHYASEQFMDEHDEDIGDNEEDIDYLSQFPQYKDFLNMMIKENYGVE